MILGISRGIERLNKIMMPLFFVLFCVLLVRVAMLPGAIDGYAYLFMPRWEALANPQTCACAWAGRSSDCRLPEAARWYTAAT